MCFGGEGISSKDQVIQGQMAGAVSMVNNDHKKRFEKGVEKGLMDWLKDDSTVQAAADTAVTNTQQQLQVGQQIQDNQMARMGIQLTPEQRAAAKAKDDIAGSALTTGEANRARVAEMTLKKAVRNPMMDLGRQSLGLGMGLYSSAAGMEQDRGTANAIEQERTRQQSLSALASGGGMALGMMG